MTAEFDPELVEQAARATWEAHFACDWSEVADESVSEAWRNIARAALSAVADPLRAEGAAERTRLENVIAEQNTLIDSLTEDLRQCAESNERLREERDCDDWKNGDLAVLTHGATGLAYADGYTWRYVEGTGSVSPLTADGPRQPRWADVQPVIERAYQRGRAEGARQVLAAVEPSMDHLSRLADQLREQGDVRQVLLTEEGVEDAPTLADELWLLAYNLRALREIVARIEGGA